MRKIIFWICIPLIGIMQSCSDTVVGEGDVITNKRKVSTFKRIKVEATADIYVNISTINELTVTAQKNIEELIHTKVIDETLIIYSDKVYSTDEGVVIQLNSNDLSYIKASGAGNVFCKAPLTTQDLDLELSGAGTMELNVAAITVSADLSGAGLIKLKGNCNEAKYKVSGAGKLDAFELVADECKVDLSGIGVAEVNASEELNASVSGAGNVYYTGAATNLKTNISGLGKVERKN
ncbi:MAG: DUF2807 domain-containing protein [Bacteroidetes bacterium]|nr:DUF2807 domain-containing protein [Bacteroidota bacterium]